MVNNDELVERIEKVEDRLRFLESLFGNTDENKIHYGIAPGDRIKLHEEYLKLKKIKEIDAKVKKQVSKTEKAFWDQLKKK